MSYLRTQPLAALIVALLTLSLATIPLPVVAADAPNAGIIGRYASPYEKDHYLELRADGTGTMCLFGKPKTVTYTVKENNVTLNAPESPPLTVEIANGLVTLDGETWVRAGDAAAAAALARLSLPKCYIPLAKLAGTCQGALVATLVSVDFSEPGPPGATDFQSHWKVIQTLRGNYPSDAKLQFRVQLFPERDHARMPVIGQTYILVSYDINPTQIAYIFENTPDKLREIEELLSANKRRSRP